MKEIQRNVPISIEPSVGEIADIIWSMDSDEQTFLLMQLAFKLSKKRMNGYMQMLAIAESIKERDVIETVGDFIDDLHEYIGYDVLKAESEET
jgi:hypothetical protein